MSTCGAEGTEETEETETEGAEGTELNRETEKRRTNGEDSGLGKRSSVRRVGLRSRPIRGRALILGNEHVAINIVFVSGDQCPPARRFATPVEPHSSQCFSGSPFLRIRQVNSGDSC